MNLSKGCHILVRTVMSNSAQADLKAEVLRVGRNASRSPTVVWYRDCSDRVITTLPFISSNRNRSRFHAIRRTIGCSNPKHSESSVGSCSPQYRDVHNSGLDKVSSRVSREDSLNWNRFLAAPPR
jgi:hypothetical protein